MTWNKINHSLNYTRDKFLSIHVRISREKVTRRQKVMQQWVTWVEWTSLQVALTSCPMYWAFSSLSGSLLPCSLLPKLVGFLEWFGNGALRGVSVPAFCLLTLLNRLSNTEPVLAVSYRSWIFAKTWQSSERGEQRSQKQQTTQHFGSAAWICHCYPTPASL